MSNTIKKTQDVLALKLETKAFKYIEITDQIRQLTKIRTVLKDEIVPVINNYKDKRKNFKDIKIGKTTVDFFLEVLEKDVNRFDTTQFKKDEPKLYTDYLKPSTSIELKGKILS
jgi:hypothetical protein